MNKIVVRIYGGLGNQLFCYAAARRLSFVNNLQLKLDTVSGFKKDQYQRKYLLYQFNVHGETANPRESFDFMGGISRRLIKLFNKFMDFEKRFYITEESIYHFDPRILNLRPKCALYMDGYWQSEKYFEDIESVIRNDIKITVPHESITLQESELIKNVENSICLGIRLYQEVTKTGIHIALPKEYYRKAVEKIVELVEEPHFFIFCNDRKKAESHFHVPYPHTFVTPKPENERAYEDLWLMSLCQHFIISNSSYHWWGAWLSENKDKIVITPEKGFYNKDIIPDRWIRMKSNIKAEDVGKNGKTC